MRITTLVQAKRIVKIIVGFTLVAAGAATLLLPGPAWSRSPLVWRS
jgi:hypothetical protein